MTHRFKVGQEVFINKKKTKIVQIYDNAVGGYKVNPPIEGIVWWNEDAMEVTKRVLLRQATEDDGEVEAEKEPDKDYVAIISWPKNKDPWMIDCSVLYKQDMFKILKLFAK